MPETGRWVHSAANAMSVRFTISSIRAPSLTIAPGNNTRNDSTGYRLFARDEKQLRLCRDEPQFACGCLKFFEIS
jgi:hypothetical protein